MKAITLKSFLNGRERVNRGDIIDLDEPRFAALQVNGLVKAAETPPEPADPAPSGDECEIKPKRGRRPKGENA